MIKIKPEPELKPKRLHRGKRMSMKAADWKEAFITSPVKTVTRRETVTPAKGGRGKRVHASDADRQRAYRKRKEAS